MCAYTFSPCSAAETNSALGRTALQLERRTHRGKGDPCSKWPTNVPPAHSNAPQQRHTLKDSGVLPGHLSWPDPEPLNLKRGPDKRPLSSKLLNLLASLPLTLLSTKYLNIRVNLRTLNHDRISFLVCKKTTTPKQYLQLLSLSLKKPETNRVVKAATILDEYTCIKKAG